MHPTVKAKLREYYRESNQRLYQMLGRDFQWDEDETAVLLRHRSMVQLSPLLTRVQTTSHHEHRSANTP